MQSLCSKSAGLKLLFILFLILLPTMLQAQFGTRREINIPDILNYKTLKCDLHMHTVFSDGDVWPTVRIEEAWREGLDAIAITDHAERNYRNDKVLLDRNLSFEIAKSKAESMGITLIRGIEITKSMPPGHFNALFITDASILGDGDWLTDLTTAFDQGAFIVWNHPGWKGQQKDGIGKWYDEHTQLYNQNIMKGIEVVNEYDYYPEVHRWCLDKNLTMMGNSDMHDPSNLIIDFANNKHRTMTLVFASGNNQTAIQDALLNHRTAVYYQNTLIGREYYLNEIFKNSVSLLNEQLILHGKKRVYLQIHNSSDIDYELTLSKEPDELIVPSGITLFANRTVMLEIQAKDTGSSWDKTIKIPYVVKNLVIEPDKGLPVSFDVMIKYYPEN